MTSTNKENIVPLIKKRKSSDGSRNIKLVLNNSSVNTLQIHQRRCNNDDDDEEDDEDESETNGESEDNNAE